MTTLHQNKHASDESLEEPIDLRISEEAVLTGEQIQRPAVFLGDGRAVVDDGLGFLGGLEADVSFTVSLQCVHAGHRRYCREGVL